MRQGKRKTAMKGIATVLLLALLSTRAGAAPPSVYVEDLAWPEVRDAIAGGANIAIYYAGSTEQNGPHMATGKHNIVARHVAGQIAAALGNALVFPVMPFAPTGDTAAKTGHMRFPGSVTVSEETYAAVGRDVAASARAAGFKHVLLMGDHGGGQKALEKLAGALDGQWAALGTRVHYIPDVYFLSERRVRDYLTAHKLPVGEHAGIHDTAELMALDSARNWVRGDKLQPGDGRNGVEGDPRQATSELGRLFIQFKVDAAVAQIRRLVAPR
jgi:creatinine amidohydrolase